MSTLQQDFDSLEKACFAMEAKLPMFTLYSADTDASYIRRELYNLRIQMGALQSFADKKGIEYV
jgi:hypothetical protein